jgi:uncharacterized protein (DUF1800 family)
MLSYLDGRMNKSGKPNENYARELLELHTLGVSGGYRQQDVMEAARALTGWHVKDHFWRGSVKCEPEAHDQGTKTVLGVTMNGDAASDLNNLIATIVRQPATANFISTKLCRYFVGDDPSPQLIVKVSQQFQNSDGDIRQTLRTLLLSPEFLNAPKKLKRPYTFTISTLRAVGASSDGGAAIQDHLRAMGQLPFNWPTPDGYPQGEAHWRAQLLPRWNFAFALVNGEIKVTRIESKKDLRDTTTLASTLLQRELKTSEQRALNDAGDGALALLLCAPDFQYQ